MITVRVINNVVSKTLILPKTSTLRQAFDEAEVQYLTGIPNLDGSTLLASDLDRTFESFDVGENATLTSIAKASNA